MNSRLQVFVDGACPLCSREVGWLRRVDQSRQLVFIDISEPDFDPAPTGRSLAQLMSRIHARLPDGQLIEGVEVFRQVYARLGFTRLVSISRYPGLRHALAFSYALFARSRLRLTGRCNLLAKQPDEHEPALTVGDSHAQA